MCLSIVDADVVAKGPEAVASVAKTLVAVLEKEGVDKFVKSWRELQQSVSEALDAA